jgi:hypothetical protein
MQMGIGKLGQPGVIIKRKFRWTLEFATPAGPVPRHYVKTSGRPQLDLDELELNFLNGTTWIPGKGKWQQLTVTYIDVNDQEMKPLYDWVARVFDYTAQNPIDDIKQSERSGYAGTATLKMYDGCGKEIDQWILRSCWPQSINFGDLDYASSDEATIDLTLRFSEVTYSGLACGFTPKGKCEGC